MRFKVKNKSILKFIDDDIWSDMEAPNKKEIDQLSISSGDHTLGGTESDEDSSSPAWVNLKESIDFHIKIANENRKSWLI